MNNLQHIKQEINWSDSAEECVKDILVVVHNQLVHLRRCIDSIFLNTKNFNLFIWNNNSDKETTDYLNEISKLKNVKIFDSKENIGFIVPNNKMIKECESEWIILLNSDTEVIKNWDTVLIGFLINNKEVKQVGFCGGKLNKQGKGVFEKSGFDIDYVCGYCFCINKQTYKKFGLFDEDNLEFAYCEDADFSLRIKESGSKIYACYANEFVMHYRNKTSLEILKKQKNFIKSIEKNQSYISKRWGHLID